MRNLRTADKGNTLIGDLEEIPAWLGKQLPTAYPQRSIEATANYEHGGTMHRFALTGLALLGATPPAVDSLKSLQQIMEQ
ncbi:hypothetical protein ACXZ66_11105 [Corynebacterium sp. S7]